MDDLLWFEKYRPTELEGMVLDEHITNKVEEYLENDNIPHLCFYGPPGSGKTTLALIIIEELQAQKLILNASSNDRGINTIKGRVKQFASSEAYKESQKIVFLDEADGLTPDAQKALKNTMETYSSNCRFIITANNIHAINDAILSRCTQFELHTYSKEELYDFLHNICFEESVSFNDDGDEERDDLDKLIDIFYPDVRTIINKLQQGVSGKAREFKLQNVTGALSDPKQLKRLLNKADVREARAYWSEVTDFTLMYKYLFNTYLFKLKDKNEVKSEIALEIAEYMYRDKTVVDKEINFTACCISIMGILDKKIKF